MKDAAYSANTYVPNERMLISYSWKINLKHLGIPQDGSAWQVRLEVWDSPPPDGKRLVVSSKTDRPYVVNTRRLTPVDSLQWGWKSGLFSRSPDSCRWMLTHFPYDGSLVAILFWDAFDNKNCDSLHYYAGRLMNIEKNRLDPIYLDRSMFYSDGIDHDPGPFPLVLENFNMLCDSVMSVCGDTSGLGKYRPEPPDSLPVFDHTQWLKRKLEEERQLKEEGD